MPIKTQSAKGKGRRLQNFVRDLILDRFPWLGEGDIESRSMGSSGVDVVMSPLARKTLPVSLECKKTKKTPSRAELEQSRSNAYGTTIPGVVWCPHGCGHKKSMVMFDLNDFLDWYESISPRELERLKDVHKEKSS
jgi:hypothetical protein